MVAWYSFRSLNNSLQSYNGNALFLYVLLAVAINFIGWVLVRIRPEPYGIFRNMMFILYEFMDNVMMTAKIILGLLCLFWVSYIIPGNTDLGAILIIVFAWSCVIGLWKSSQS